MVKQFESKKNDSARYFRFLNINKTQFIEEYFDHIDFSNLRKHKEENAPEDNTPLGDTISWF